MHAHPLEDIDIPVAIDGKSAGLHGLLGVPEGAGPWPAVVVVHEIYGIDEEMRKQVAHLATLGYIALMPDLFSEGGMRRCVFATFRSLRTGAGRAFADIEAARETLIARADCTGAIGVIGFCMGGGFALLAASLGYQAAASNYGMIPRDLDAAFENACPIVGSYGGKDGAQRGAAAKLDAALTARGIPHDVKEYPNAGHAFMNDRLNGPAWLSPIARIANLGPRPDEAKDAWSRIDSFFSEHLSGTSAESR